MKTMVILHSKVSQVQLVTKDSYSVCLKPDRDERLHPQVTPGPRLLNRTQSSSLTVCTRAETF